MSGDTVGDPLQLGGLDSDGEVAFTVRRVSPTRVVGRLRRSPLELAPLFGEADVLATRVGRTPWYIGRSAAWTRQVIGSRTMAADVDILPLGLGAHPTYYAMGGLPGAPPVRHQQARRTAVAAGFRNRMPSTVSIEAAIDRALDLSVDETSRVVDLRVFSRALFLTVAAECVAGFTIDVETTRTILGWFDRWSAIMSNPLVVAGAPALPFTPAGQLHAVLDVWYRHLAAVLEAPDAASGTGLVAGLRAQVDGGEIASQEAVGYLATILFAGTEPPAHTLLWGHAHAVTVGTDLGPVDATRAEALLWEAFRVRPAVNLVVRRRAASPAAYGSSSREVFVVAPPLTHAHTNEQRGLPHTFTPELVGSVTVDPDDYPGLGSGAHYCIGARLGMHVGRVALSFLLAEGTLIEAPDLRASGLIVTEPRRLPRVVVR